MLSPPIKRTLVLSIQPLVQKPAAFPLLIYITFATKLVSLGTKPG